MSKYYVYVVINQINNKLYIGKTNKPDYRWGQHKKVARGGPSKYPNEFSVVHKAIQKYGESNFEFVVLEEFDTENEAYYFETWWIEFLLFNISGAGYNLNIGGKGGLKPSPATLAKKSLAAQGKTHTLDTRNKLSLLNTGTNNPSYGLKRTDETIAKMSQKQRGENNPFSKITEQIVLQLRLDYDTGKYTYKKLAEKYNLTYDHAYRIAKRKVWDHL